MEDEIYLKELLLKSTPYRLMDYDLLVENLVSSSSDHSKTASSTTENNRLLDEFIQKNLRLNKKFFNQVLKLDSIQLILIAEPSSIDTAVILSLLRAIEAANDQIEIKIYLRDTSENMDSQTMANDTASFPLIYGLNKAGELLFRWGPRSRKAESLLCDTSGFMQADRQGALLEFYKSDLTRDIQEEWLALLR